MAPQTSLGNILIVDDEEAITDLLSLNLRSEGYNVAVISRTSEVDLRELRSFHLVIVDGKNQDFTGLSLIKKIKESPVGDMLGIIYCSRIDNERILIDALNAGADDCMRKPFSLRELLARIKAVMRRWTVSRTSRTPEERGDVTRIGSMRIDTSRKTVTIEEEFVNLSNTEFAILELLLRNANTYTSRIEIFKKIWPDGVEANERVVDTNISRLRRKLGDAGSCISNRQGLGYMIVTDNKSA